MSASSFALAPLRQELGLAKGPADAEGAPTWTITDPATGRFFRIGWMEFETLRRWHLGQPEAVAAAVRRETPLELDAEEVTELAQFLARNQLLRLPGEVSTRLALTTLRNQQGKPLQWLLHHYLFFRLPMGAPDQFYTTLLAWLGWLLRPGFAWVSLGAGLLGLHLATRQLDSFLSGFPYLATGHGLLLAILAYVLLKVLHELGHGLVAKSYGLRLKSVGIAVMVFCPMFYTDTTEAWRLPDRAKRLRIGAAGIAAEALIACWALLAWNFLPDGLARSVAFIWATTAWMLTLMVNASPFMRFDGYYLLADWLDEPNLQEQSFALGRWQLRRLVLGYRGPAPFTLPPRRQAGLILYAWVTWCWRALLFLGIAALVYHTTFKLLGLLLAAVEVGWFLARPVANEMRAWRELPRSQLRPWRMALSALLLGGVVFALALPWRQQVAAPAILGAQQRAEVLAPEAGRFQGFLARRGEWVAAGAPLARLEAPDLAYRLEQARLRLAVLDWQAMNLGQQRETVARAQLAESELETTRAEIAVLIAQQAALLVRAPFAGRLLETQPDLTPGDWVPRSDPLAYMLAPGELVVDAYVPEAELSRLRPNQPAWFIPHNPDLPRLPLRLESIAEVAVAEIREPEVAAFGAGALLVRQQPGQPLQPLEAVYPLRLRLEAPPTLALHRLEPGEVLIEAEAASLLLRAWRRVFGVLVRESGF